MTEKTHGGISFEDIKRLMKELEMMDGDDDTIDTWFEDHGFAEKVGQEVAECGFDGLGSILHEYAAREAEENDEPGMRMVPPEIFASAIGAITVGMFQIGWEARAQYGKPNV